ncbi:hypothetical protein ACA910_012188 [Epithemia clementina (nom. ined.)]
MVITRPTSHSVAHAIQAVGSGELACRAAGNCLETGEWDGAIGWTWGAKDRCDAVSDPTCGANGKLMVVDANGRIVGKPVRSLSDPTRITHVVALQLDIGRSSSGSSTEGQAAASDNILRLGLYGNDAPTWLVEQMLDFCNDDKGLSTLSAASIDNMMIGQVTAPVSLTRGGAATWVTPGTSIEFGVPNQALAYAKNRGSGAGGRSSQILDLFVPQPRPKTPQEMTNNNNNNNYNNNNPLLMHNGPGLLSVSKKGLGYGGTGFENDNECFERAFLITNNAAPQESSSLDKTRMVIGQVLDPNSMAFLERLTNLPTNRGIRGVLPGQNDGPPLARVVVRQAKVATVVNQPTIMALNDK